jgi:hypothetical protein
MPPSPQIPPPRKSLPSSSRPQAAAAAELLAAAVLCVAAVVGALALGGTLPWACFGLEAAMATGAILWAVARPRPVTKLLLPLSIAALVFAQLIPLPDRLLTAIAPVSAGAWKFVHEGLPEACGWISITPAASAAAARRLLLGVATILVVADLSREPRLRRWLYTSLATAGFLVWLIAFVFPIDPNNRVVYGVFSLRGPIEFWKTPERPPMQTAGVDYLDWVTVGDQRYLADGAIAGDGFGPYIYSNHFADALCLTIPALCAMWLVSTRKRLPRWVAVGVVVLIFVGAVWTTGGLAGSRAGTASLLLSAAVYLALISEHRITRWSMAAVAAVGTLMLLGFVAVFQGPLRGLVQFAPGAWAPTLTAVLDDTRMIAARIAGRMFLASPVLGTGLGSYGDLFPRFVGREQVLYFAHNDHAQLLAEGGSVALFVAAIVGGILSWRFIRFCRERQPVSRTVDAAAWAALVGGAAHSVFDWNMHAAANAFLGCVIIGLALSSVVQPTRGSDQRELSWANRLAIAAFVPAVVAAAAFRARDAMLQQPLGQLRRAITAGRLAKTPADHQAAADRLRSAITAGEAADRYAPRDWPLPMLIGQAYLHLK